MSNIGNLNKLERFRRLSIHDEWPECFICRKKVSSGLTLYIHDFGENEVELTTVCDICISKAKSSRIGWVIEGET